MESSNKKEMETEPMPERRAATIDQLHDIKDQLDSLTDQVEEIDSKLSAHIELNKDDVIQTQSSFIQVKEQLTEVKNKVNEIETSLPARILIVEDNLATIREHQTQITPKVDDIYEIIAAWRGFSKAIGWISENLSRLFWIFTTVATIGTGGYYLVEYFRGRFVITPIEVGYHLLNSMPNALIAGSNGCCFL